MKMKKYLLPGMMAALAFAACTNEEIVSQQTSEAPKADLSKRPVVGQVDLNFGPQTRLGLDEDGNFNTIEWALGDKMGARIIDEPNFKLYKNHSIRYGANDDYASSNYKYTRDASGNWYTEALMVEGHYMFYAPYDESARDRSPLKIKFPLVQQVDPNAALMKGVNVDAIRNFFGNTEHKGYTVGIGHAFIDASEEETTYTPEFTHLYAYPELTLVNNVPDPEWDGTPTENPGMTIKIDSIRVLGADIFEEYKALHSGIMTALRDEVTTDVAGNNDKKQDGSRKDGFIDNTKYIKRGYWRALNDTTVYYTAKTADILTGQGADKGMIRVKFDTPLEIEAGEEYKLNVILPAKQYSSLFIQVFSGKEILDLNVATLGVESAEIATSLTYTPGKRYPREEYNFDKNHVATVKQSCGKLATVELSGKFVAYNPPATDLTDLKAFAAWLAKNVDDNTDQTIVESPTTFTFAEKDGYSVIPFNQALMDTIDKYLDKGMIGFSSNFKMSGDITVSNKIGGLGDIKHENGTLKISNIEVGNIDANKAVLTGVTAKAVKLSGESTLDGGTYTENATFNGKVNLNNNVLLKKNADFKGGNINAAEINGAIKFNSGDITVKKISGNATVATIKAGNVTINKDASTTLKMVLEGGKLIVEKSDFTNNIVIGETKVDNGNTVSVKTGTLSVKADNALDNVTLNSGEVSIDGGNVIVASAFMSNWTLGTLSNNATMTANTFVIKKGQKYVHNGDINAVSLNIINTGEITNKAGKTLTVKTNNGEIIAEQGSYTTINSGTGTVNNNAKARVVVAGGEQTVYYTFTTATVDNATLDAFDSKKYGVNKVIFTQPVSLTEFEPSSKALDGVTTIDFNAGSSLHVDGLIGSSVKVVNINADVNMTGFAGLDDVYAVGFGFKYGATMNVAAGKTLTVTRMNLATLSQANGLTINLAETEDSAAKLKVDAARIGIGAADKPAAAKCTLANGGEIVEKYYNGSAFVDVP